MVVIIGTHPATGATVFIVPTEDSPCPEEETISTGSGYEYGDTVLSTEPQIQNKFMCLTLEQYANFDYNDTLDLRLNQLNFTSGEHHLDSLLSVSNSAKFMMISEGATITCSSENATILLKSFKTVIVSGLEFVGCGRIDISYIDQFILVDSSIQASQLALYHIANATIFNSTFLCTQEGCDQPGVHVGLTIEESSKSMIQDCMFSGLMRQALYASQSTVFIVNSTFSRNNEAIGIVSIDNCDLWVLYSRFVDNIGIAMYTRTGWDFKDYHQIVMEQNVFTNNHYSYHTVKDFWSSPFVAIELAIVNTTVSICNCSFTNNGFKTLNIDIWDDGINTTTSVTITGCTFVNNSWPLSLHSDFASLPAHHTITLLIKWTNFTGNSGPALSMLIDAVHHPTHQDNDAYSLTIFQSSFVNNKGERLIDGRPSMYVAAGAIMIGTWNPLFPRAFNSNRNIQPYSLMLTINESDFMHNTAANFYYIDSNTMYDYVYIQSDMRDAKDQTINILHSNFLNNTCSGSGSAVATLSGHYNLSITDCLFVNHSAEYCGALALSADSTSITRSIFAYNRVWRNGGAICTLYRAAKLSISNSVFSGNYANEDGGALSTEDSFAYYYDFDAVGNITSVSADITNCKFFNNKAGRDGGAIRVTIDANQLIIRGSSFSSNRAMGLGGAISVDRSNLEITNSTFFNNSAEIGTSISSCDSKLNISADDNTTGLFKYENPNLPLCVFYDNSTAIPILTSSLPITLTTIIWSTESTSPGSKPPLSGSEGHRVLWIVAVAVSVSVVCIVVALLFLLMGCLWRRGTLKCYKNSTPEEGNRHGTYVPLVNNL